MGTKNQISSLIFAQIDVKNDCGVNRKNNSTQPISVILDRFFSGNSPFAVAFRQHSASVNCAKKGGKA